MRGKGKHLAVKGARYTPATDSTPESPPFAAILGIALTKAHFEQRRSATVLTSAGVAAIRAATREVVARPGYDSLRACVAQGIPTVLIDHGKIHARVSFRAVTVEDAAKPGLKERMITPLKPLGELGISLPALAPQLKSVRIIVSQADAGARPTGQTVDMFGDVEITFKTV
jgi:hypothetical protein